MLLISAIILVNAVRSPLLSLLGLASYWGVILLHECGHMVAARRLHCDVYSIELYPISGFCRFEIPWSRFDHCVIAWAGVIAQAVIAVPIVLCLSLFGYTRFNSVNAVLAIFGFFSLGIAVLNLLPIWRFDGRLAWAIIPEAIKRSRLRSTEVRTRKY